MVNNIIADFTTRIRNGILVRHQIVETPATKMTIALSKILVNEGFIEKFEIIENIPNKSLLIHLNYTDTNKNPTIKYLKLVSKPGRRIYVNTKNLTQEIGNFGIAILSTSKGIMTDRQARKANIGGEVLLHIY
jgi:small subunit ribosomal protein S8